MILTFDLFVSKGKGESATNRLIDQQMVTNLQQFNCLYGLMEMEIDYKVGNLVFKSWQLTNRKKCPGGLGLGLGLPIGGGYDMGSW